MNESNLKRPTPEEAAERGRAGGIASGEARRRKRSIREALEIALAQEIEHDGETKTRVEAIAAEVIKQAEAGNLKAFELIRDTIGEKPTTKAQITTPIDDETRRQVEEIVNKYAGEGK